MRGYALTGTDTTERAKYNALREWIGMSSSMIYSMPGTQFGLAWPPYYGGPDESRITTKDLEQMTELAREEFHRLWQDGGFPEVILSAVQQAHYADTSIIKDISLRSMPGIALIADPSDVGVGDEHVPWNQQEAITHWYSVNLPQFRRILRAMVDDPKKRADLWDKAQLYATPRSEARGDFLPPALGRIMLASASPSMVGNVVNTTDTFLAIPRSQDPVIVLAELWIWDDRASETCLWCKERKQAWRHTWHRESGGHPFQPSGDYCPDWRVATMLEASDDILWETANPRAIEGHPFYPLSIGDPDEAAGYIWGIAPMEHLVGPQLWHERKLAELDLRDDLDVNPPMSGYGIPMRDGETTKGFRKPGADIPFSSPQAKIEFHRPPQLPDKFEFPNYIESRMRQLEGIPKAATGQADPSMRSGEQTLTHAMLGAGPTLTRAMMVERWLEGIATDVLRTWRNLCDRPLVRNNGQRFYLRQMPGDFTVRVHAHSASPIYTEQLKALVFAAKKEGMLTPHDALRLLNLPGTDMLLRAVEGLEKSQAEMGEKKLELAERTVKAKEEKAMKG